ncbi:unnamed protein product [Choristocarpus tenellus]
MTFSGRQSHDSSLPMDERSMTEGVPQRVEGVRASFPKRREGIHKHTTSFATNIESPPRSRSVTSKLFPSTVEFQRDMGDQKSESLELLVAQDKQGCKKNPGPQHEGLGILRPETILALMVEPKSLDIVHREETISDPLDISTKVAMAATELASSSTLAILCKTATLIAVLARLTKYYKEESEREMTRAIEWCVTMIEMLQEVDRQEIELPLMLDFLEEVHSSIEELVKVVQCFISKGLIGRTIKSSLFRRRQAEAEYILRNALRQLKVEGKTKSFKVQRSPESRSARRKIKKGLMLEQRDVPEVHVTFFHDVDWLGKGNFSTMVELVEYNGFMAAAKVTNLRALGSFRPATDILLEMFSRELIAMTLMRSEHIVNVYGAITKSPGRLVMLTEFMEGGSLRSLLRKGVKPLDDSLTFSLALDIASGMEYLHSKGMIHGNLKSSNVLLNGSTQAKVADFGMIRTREHLSSTARNTRGINSSAPLNWLAPEVLREEGVFFASDAYSFGIVVWEIVTRNLPWAKLKKPIDIVLAVCGGARPMIPANVEPLLRKVMEACWAACREDRCTFKELTALLH